MHLFTFSKSSIRNLIAGATMLFTTVPAFSQVITPLRYTCYQTNTKLVIDGKLEDAAWQQAAWTDDFTDIEGDKKPKPPLRTRVKMLWDQQYLYIAAELEEPNIWGRLLQRDTIIFHDNDFEVFIDQDDDAKEYFEIELNARNTPFDLFMPRPYNEGGHALINWDAKGMRTAVHINGTLNKPADKDKSWTVEMAIPFTALRLLNVRELPLNNTVWRINFSRVEWDTEVKNGQYVKKTNPATNRPLPEHNWVWSPQGVINMHIPQKWGYLQFSTQTVQPK